MGAMSRVNTKEIEENQIREKEITKEDHNRKTAPNGMPVYDINEPWVQQYIKDFGKEPSFF